MTMRAEMDVGRLADTGFGPRAPIWWGQLWMMAIEGMVFALMIAAYFYLNTRSVEWPPHSYPPDLFWGTFNTILFVVSVLPNDNGSSTSITGSSVIDSHEVAESRR